MDQDGDAPTMFLGFVLAAGISAAGGLAVAAAVSSWLTGERFDPTVPTGTAVVDLLAAPRTPGAAWGDPEMAGPLLYWTVFAVLCLLAVAVAVWFRRLLRRNVVGFDERDRLGTSPEAEFASRRDLRTLHVADGVGDRLLLGTVGRSQLIAAENQSSAFDAGPTRGKWAKQRGDRGAVMCVGPSRSGKTVGVISAMLAWQGPIVAVSVKDDLLRPTIAHRRRCGEVAVFDPTERLRRAYRTADGAPGGKAPSGWDERLCVEWSPLANITCFEDAQRVASSLTETAPRPNGRDGKDFWIARAEMILGPFLWLAAANSCPFSMVVHWAMERPEKPGDDVDDWIYEGFFERVAAIGSVQLRSELSLVRETLYGQLSLHEKTVDSAFATLQTVVQPWMTPAVANSASGTSSVDLEWLLSGTDDTHNTFYLSAPPDEFARLGPVYGGAIDNLLRDVYRHVETTGKPISPPLLVVLDEIANMPMKMLPEYVSTLAGLGVQLVTIWQDFGQIFAAFGKETGDTLISNHMSKLFFRGIFSRATLGYLNELSGQEEVHTTAESRDLRAVRRGSTNVAPQRVSLIPPNVVRQLPVGEALLIHGGLRPAHIQSLRWFTDPSLLALTDWSTSDVDRGLPHVSPIGNTPTVPAIDDVAPEASRSGASRGHNGIDTAAAGQPIAATDRTELDRGPERGALWRQLESELEV